MQMRVLFAAVAAFATVGALAGCGDRNLVLHVDVHSYMDSSDTHIAFGPVPVVPGGVVTGEQPVVQDVEINLLDGTESLAEVINASIGITAIASASSGSGADTLRIYMSDPAIDPLDTPPVAVLPLALMAGVPDTASVDVAVDSRVADLFVGKRLRLSMTTSLRGPDSGSPLNGELRLTALDAMLVAGRKPDM